MPDEPFSLKLYRWLIKLYPAGFRENYAGPLEREFRDELSQSQGLWARACLWYRLLVDLAISIPAQVSREVSQDVRHALRVWANRPWQIGFAIVALAIGIGANTGVFSVVNALLLRSLPFQEPHRLASLSPQEFIPPHDSAKQFHEWHRQSTYAADAALVEENDVNLGGVHDPGRAHLAHTSWNFFETFGTRPVLGRAFLPDQDTAGRNGEVLIGYGLWQQLFAGEPRVLGSLIRVDGQPLTIIGVAPPGFRLSESIRSLEARRVFPWQQWLGDYCPAEIWRRVAASASRVCRRRGPAVAESYPEQTPWTRLRSLGHFRTH